MTLLHRGTAFGIHFVSNLHLAEFHPAVDNAAGLPLVTVQWHTARPQQLLDLPGHCRWSGSHLELCIPAACDFDVTTERIDIHPAPGVDPQGVRAYLAGSAIGALLHLRGTRVFHGSCVRTPDGSAALFCGHSTAGKSTLAASLAQRGHEALADDLAALHIPGDGRPVCEPGLSRTKLWRDALQRLGLEGQVGPHTQVLPSLDKHSLPLHTGQQPALLTRFYEIQVDESSSSALRMAPVFGMEKLTVLLTHIYRPQYLHAMGQQHRLLADVGQLASQLQVHRITRPRQGDTLPAILDWLQGQWRTSPRPPL